MTACDLQEECFAFQDQKSGKSILVAGTLVVIYNAALAVEQLDFSRDGDSCTLRLTLAKPIPPQTPSSPPAESPPAG